ncbi:MyTH4 domain [Trinorchestia longiramus]|nr:MyTH4 domain [Trinorchestia longiramus]
MAYQSSISICRHLILKENIPGKYLLEVTKLVRGLYTSTSHSGAEFRMPARVPRSPTDILKALDSTVSKDKTGPHYRYHDDPFLTPTTPMEKRVCSLSKESGRKAAVWVRDQHPHLFTSNMSDEPVIKRFMPVLEYTENDEVSEELLLQFIGSCQVEDAATVYRLCTDKQIELSSATKQSLLELLCYYNQEEPVSDEWLEELNFSQIQRPGKDVLNTWKTGGLADELFDALEQPSAAAYSALIRGLSKYNSVDDAWIKYQEAQAAGLALDVDTLNSLLLTVPLRHEGYEERQQIIIGLLKSMASQGQRPNLQTLNNCLQVLANTAFDKRKGFSLELVAEMVRHGVKPSLATYFYLITMHYRNPKDNSDIMFSILDELEKHEGDLPLLDPHDSFFFMQAMDVCCNSLQNLDAARRLHAILETGKNDRLLGENPKEMIYYRYYMTLSLKQLPFDEFMLVYDDLVPHVYFPETAVVEMILTTVGVQSSFQYLPTLWTDMSSVILNNERLLTALISCMTHYTPDPADVSYQDGSPKAEQQLHNEFVNKPIPLRHQLSRIIDHIVTSAEEALELTHSRKPNWTSSLVSQMLSVVSVCGDAQVGRRLLQLVAERPDVVVGEVPSEQVHQLCTLAVKEKDFVTAMSCISYVRRHDSIAAQAMASEVAAAEPLDAAVRAKLNVILGGGALRFKAKREEKPDVETSETSSSSSSDDSDSSSSDEEEEDKTPKDNFFPTSFKKNKQLEWVEIIEPTSRNIMYANLTTGQCVWELPSSVPYKKFDANQWWELFDNKTSRFYYYNATSSKTVWHRPQNCDIIPLAKLQVSQVHGYNIIPLAKLQVSQVHGYNIIPLGKLQQLKQNTEVGCGPEVGIFSDPQRGSGSAARGSSTPSRSPALHHQLSYSQSAGGGVSGGGGGGLVRRHHPRHHHHYHDSPVHDYHHNYPPHPPPQPSPSPSPRLSRRNHHHNHSGDGGHHPRRVRRASQSSQASSGVASRSIRDGFEGSSSPFLAKQQSLDGSAGPRGGSGGSGGLVLLRGIPASESSLERPRQLGLSRSHSFMSGPVGTAGSRGLGDHPSSSDRSMARLHHEGGASDSLEGLATPMLHRRHRQDAGLDRRPDSADRYRYDSGDSTRVLRPSASAHTSLHHSSSHRPHSDSESSPSPPTQRHRFSPLESPHRFSPLESPHRLPDSGTSTLTTEHTSCCSPHASHHSLFDSGHMSMGTTGSRGSEGHNRHRKSVPDSAPSSRKSVPDASSSSRKSDRGSDVTTSPSSSAAAGTPTSSGGSRSKCSHHRSSGGNSHHHHHHHGRHQCAKHRGSSDKHGLQSSSHQKQQLGGGGVSTSSTNTNSSTKTVTTDSDTINTNNSSHHNHSNSSASLRGSPSTVSTKLQTSSTSSVAAATNNHCSNNDKCEGAKTDVSNGSSGGGDDDDGGQQHHDLTHLYSNLDYVYRQPVYQYILEQAQLSGYRLGDRVLGGDGDSLQSDSDTSHRLDDSDHFADDEAVSNADSSSQENLDGINYLADDETYTQFFTPPVPASPGLSSPVVHKKSTPEPMLPISSPMAPSAFKSSKFVRKPGLPLSNVSNIGVLNTSNVPASTGNMPINSGSSVMVVGNTTSSGNSNNTGISGVISLETGGGGVMGFGASSESIAECLSKLSMANSSTGSALSGKAPPSSKQTVVDGDTDGSNVMENYAKQNLNTHTRGLLRKKVPVMELISWTKSGIRKPLTAMVDKGRNNAACDMFRLVQVYMGDRKAKPGMTLNSVALDIVSLAYTSPCLRDELFVQLCKQTTDNQKNDSLKRGWELLAVALQFFPPSETLAPHLGFYIERHTNSNYLAQYPDVNKWPIHIQVAHYAGVCQKRLTRSRTRQSSRRPCPVELDLSKMHIFRASMFCSSLHDIMQLQRDRYPHRRLPWVQTTLSEEVLRLQGTNTEGIFRVNADSDEVQQLRQHAEQWDLGDCRDAHVAAGVLKLWYRELYEPLIPDSLYGAAVDAHDNPAAALALFQHLPPTHRLVLAYLIRFLQYFAQPDIVAATKMSADNLAVVMAPNCLRCTSDNPVVMYNNSRKETAFLRLLIQHLDTTFMEGVV